MTATIRAVAVGAQGPMAPAFRIRTRVPAAALARNGIELQSLPLFDTPAAASFSTGGPVLRASELLRAHHSLHRRLSALSDDVELALIQRQADMLPLLRLERLACRDRRVVLDVDDAIWLDTSANANAHRLAFLKGTARKARWLGGRADHVIAGNDRIAEWFSGLTDNISVVPSLIDHHEVALRAHAADGRVVLGWIGSPSTAPYLRAIVRPLELLAAGPEDVRYELVVVGGRAPAIRGMDVRERAWSPAAEREILARMDIGLMPLPDDDWTRSKCAYKALLYMAAGIPVVADPVGASAAVIEGGGLLPADRDGWCEAIRALARDVELRRRLGAHGRRRIEAEFSVERWSPVLSRILRG